MNFHRNMGGYGVTAIIRDKRYNYHLHSVCTPFFLNKQNAQNRRKLHTKKKHSALACLRPAPSHLVARNGLFSKHSASLEHREENIKKNTRAKTTPPHRSANNCDHSRCSHGNLADGCDALCAQLHTENNAP